MIYIYIPKHIYLFIIYEYIYHYTPPPPFYVSRYIPSPPSPPAHIYHPIFMSILVMQVCLLILCDRTFFIASCCVCEIVLVVCDAQFFFHSFLHMCVFIYMYTPLYLYIYIYMYIHIYIYIYTIFICYSYFSSMSLIFISSCPASTSALNCLSYKHFSIFGGRYALSSLHKHFSIFGGRYALSSLQNPSNVSTKSLSLASLSDCPLFSIARLSFVNY